MVSGSPSKMDKAMTEEQFTQVVDAILRGKYSWACVLILRFAGYNPLHYIPYRTYNRLVKDNEVYGRSRKSSEPIVATHPNSRKVTAIRDLNYLESADSLPTYVQGGNCSRYMYSISQMIGNIRKHFQ
jgi:hypothetical protein